MILTPIRCDFSEVLEIWTRSLWPERKSIIRSISAIKFLGGADPNIYKFADPVFWAIHCGTEIVGVNSGLTSGPCEFRSRGLWVHPTFRRRGLAAQLLLAAEEEARRRRMKTFWSIPRTVSLGPYLKTGMKISSLPLSEDFEFGPNVFAAKYLPITDAVANPEIPRPTDGSSPAVFE